MNCFSLALGKTFVALAVLIPAGLMLGFFPGGLILTVAPGIAGYWARLGSSARLSTIALLCCYLAILAVLELWLAVRGYAVPLRDITASALTTGLLIIPSGLVGVALAISGRVRKFLHTNAAAGV